MRSRFSLVALACALHLSACSSPSASVEEVSADPQAGYPVNKPRAPETGALAALRTLSAAGEAPAELAALAEANLGPTVEVATLTRFLPQALLEYTAESQHDLVPAKGATRVERLYTRGRTRLRVSITDTSTEPAARAPFAFVHMIREVSAQAYRQGSRIDGRPRLSEWRDGTSKLQTLVANRFVIHIQIEGAVRGEAEQVASALDIDGLAALAETQGEQG